ncbi:MAG: carbonic anhydrase family protein [Candidatus Obscuribacterales bacterium]|jgi:carbonic anhydrase|nr:carbonic anhydrase family protein [Candidatus Obscuribacterales bacterium]
MKTYFWPQQSPIDLSKSTSHYVHFDNSFLKIKYSGQCSGSFESTHHNFVLSDFEKNPQLLSFNGKEYILRKIHLHTPSEHDLDGQNLSGDIHFVHEIYPIVDENAKTEDRDLLVLGVFFNLCEETEDLKGNELTSFAACFSNALKLFKEGKASEEIPINPSNLLPSDKDWFWYQGSLTSPPYSENVTWVVLNAPLKDTQNKDFEYILKEAHQEERGIQDLNRRFVLRNFK